MPTILGRAVTISTPVSSNQNQILAALYAYFDGTDPNWRIKAGVTIPPHVTTVGDQGFIIEDIATGALNVAFGTDSTGAADVGGQMIDGGATSSTDDMLIGFTPGGDMTDITAAGWAPGARWSGWCADAQGSGAGDGRAKISSGTDWLFVRFKSGGVYGGGFFAGRYDRADVGIGDGNMIAAGTWADWASQSANDHIYYESHAGVWRPCRLQPGNPDGIAGDDAHDGAGAFRLGPVSVNAPKNGTITTTFTSYSLLGTLPALMASANGTAGKQWTASDGTIRGYNLDGGSWIALDDGGVEGGQAAQAPAHAE